MECLALEVGSISCSETSGRIYNFSLRKILKQHSSCSHGFGSLKSRINLDVSAMKNYYAKYEEFRQATKLNIKSCIPHIKYKYLHFY